MQIQGVNTINNNYNTNFGAKFYVNEALRELRDASQSDRALLRLARRFKRRHRGHEIIIDSYSREVLDSSVKHVVEFHNMHNNEYGCYRDLRKDKDRRHFDMKNFLRYLIRDDGVMFFSRLDDKIDHNLTGSKRSIRYLIKTRNSEQ